MTDQSKANTNPDSTKTEQTQTESKDGNTLLTQDKKPETQSKTEIKEGEKKDETKSEGAPESYADYTVPEGYTLDPAVKTEVDKLFKDMNLSQTQAQTLVDFYTKQTSESFAAPFKAYQDMTNGWRTESESHPDLKGKLGPGQEVNVRIAKALDSLGDAKLASDFRELMDLTGAGNHQAFIRVIDRFAQKVTEGSHVAGNGPAKPGQSRPGEAPPSAAAAMWPSLPSANAGR